MSFKIDSSIRAKYYNTKNRGAPKWIVLHYTGNSGITATAKGNANYFHTCPRKASAHYVVDEKETIYQCVPDQHAAYSVGDSSNGHGTYYNKCTNSNSVSIEMVSHSDKSGYYIPAETLRRAAELTQYLMKKYNIDASHVIRHYDVTTKLCPEPMCGSTAKNAKWTEFKKMLTTSKETAVNRTMQVKVSDGSLNVRSGAGTNYGVVGTLKNNTQVYVISAVNDWYKITYNGTYGYVSCAYIVKCEANNLVASEEDDVVVYKTIDDIPSYGKAAVQELIDKQYLAGSGVDEKGRRILNLTESMLRMIVINTKAGLYK